MNRLKFFISVFVACSLLNTVTANSSSGDSTNKSCDVARVVLRHVKPAKNRPNAPSRLSIECLYWDGFVQPIFPEGVISLSIRIYNDTEEWTETVTTENNIAVFPVLMGAYYIECISDNGLMFIGEIEF